MATAAKQNRSGTEDALPPSAPPVPPAVDEHRPAESPQSESPLSDHPGYDPVRRGIVHLDPREELRRRINEARQRLSS